MSIDRDCSYYNWGGDSNDPSRPSYPREYGARCEHHDAFFVRNSLKEEPTPNCSTCKKSRRDFRTLDHNVKKTAGQKVKGERTRVHRKEDVFISR